MHIWEISIRKADVLDGSVFKLNSNIIDLVYQNFNLNLDLELNLYLIFLLQ